MTAEERLASGRAWDDFCDQIKQAGHIIDRFGDEPDDLDQAEWYRFLTRVLRSTFVKYVENSDPDRPLLINGTQWRQHLFYTTPDQDHLVAEFPEPGHSYRLWGTRGSSDHFVIATWEATQPDDIAARDWAPLGTEGLAQFNPAAGRSTSFMTDANIDFDEHGRFEITLSPERLEGVCNHLWLKPDCRGLLIRMLHFDRKDYVAADIQIERVDRPARYPLTQRRVADGLARAAQHLLAYAEDTRACWFEKWGREKHRIVFDQSVYLTNGGVADRQLGFGTWAFAEDEAMVLHFTPPECEYWNFHASSMWQEAFDTIEDGGSTVQKYKAVYECDGSVRIILSARDPGIGGNWMDRYQHAKGGMCMRYVGTNSPPPPIDIRIVPIAELERRELSGVDIRSARVARS